MGIIDQFLQGHVQGGLEPGEPVMGTAMLRHPTFFNMLGVPQKYDDYLAVATDRRLIVFETDSAFSLGISPQPRPIARNPHIWRYDELARVSFDNVEGLVIHSGGAGTWMSLVPHSGCGPLASEQPQHDLVFGKARRYDVYAQIAGIDGQRAFHAQFPRWLSERVAAGAFPMSPARRAEVEGRIAERRAILAAEQARRLQAAAERDAKIQAAWVAFRPYSVHAGILAGALLVALPLGWELADRGSSRVSDGSDGVAYYEALIPMIERDNKSWVNDPKLEPPADCPEARLPYFSGVSRPKDGEELCHMCTVRDRDWYESVPGGRKLTRGGKHWTCPAPAKYASALKAAKKGLDEEQSNFIEGIVYLVIAGALALGGLVASIVAAVLLWKKRKSLRAAGQGPGAPPGMGPVLGAPTGPG